MKINFTLVLTMVLLYVPLFTYANFTNDICDKFTRSHTVRDTTKINELSNNFNNLAAVIDNYARQTIQRGNINSLAISVYRNGQIYEQYYGVLDQKDGLKPSVNTVYEIASISKVFLGSLAAKAVIEQRITLEDDITLYLPGPYLNLNFQGTPITIKNLLTHTLGFENKTPQALDDIYLHVKQGYYQNKHFDYTIEMFLKELKNENLNKKPGDFYEYNSVGPEIMAYILEQVYNKPYKELIRDLLKEINLKNTYLYDSEVDDQFIAPSFDENDELAPMLKNPLLGGSHGMLSTLTDLTKFVQFELENKAPWIQESVRLLFTDTIDGDDKGYFWDVGYGKKEGSYYGKTGTSNGVQSGILICPDSHYGMVIIMNNTSDKAQDDWEQLYNKIETALIVYPKINLVSLLSNDFNSNFEIAKNKYLVLSKDAKNYLSGSFYLNKYGYELHRMGEFFKAIEIIKFAISLDKENANLYDSLAEIYYVNNYFEQALVNYKKALDIDPTNINAKKAIDSMQRR